MSESDVDGQGYCDTKLQNSRPLSEVLVVWGASNFCGDRGAIRGLSQPSSARVTLRLVLRITTYSSSISQQHFMGAENNRQIHNGRPLGPRVQVMGIALHPLSLNYLVHEVVSDMLPDSIPKTYPNVLSCIPLSYPRILRSIQYPLHRSRCNLPRSLFADPHFQVWTGMKAACWAGPPVGLWPRWLYRGL